MEYYVNLFVSRNKENRDVADFHQRKEAFLAAMDDEHVSSRFDSFVHAGVSGEVCRWYRSVNARKMGKVRKALITKLVNDDNLVLTRMDSLTASLAAKPENAATKFWLFDVDISDVNEQVKFLMDLKEAAHLTEIPQENEEGEKLELPVLVGTRVYKTPNGLGVVVYDGFNPLELLGRWEGKVELKRDAMVFLKRKKRAVVE